MKKRFLAAISCACVLSSCSMMRENRAPKIVAAAPRPAPPPSPPPEPASDLPVSIPQTQVTLPAPQPIQAEALATILPDTPPPPEPATPAVRPTRPIGPRPEPRQQTTAPAQVTPPEAPPPATVTPAPSRRLRPVESPAERQRLLQLIASQQQKVQEVLTKARNRPLTDLEKGTVERIQAFLEQTQAALKDQDLQQADALSKRALLLSQEIDK